MNRTVRILALACVLGSLSLRAVAQTVKRVNDKHIRHQQERMVFKQWDRNKFTPTRGFLSLNYQYWITWALHPSYPTRDRRPLSATGFQTQRLALVLAMQHTEDAYKRHADTLRNTALTETVNYAGAVSGADPLWLLYFKREFSGLLERQHHELLQALPIEVQRYLVDRGIYGWVSEERDHLRERVDAAHTTDMDRGSRIIAYHRMLLEYRQLVARWDTQCRNAQQYLALMDRHRRVQGHQAATRPSGRSDVQIARDILTTVK